MSDVSNNIEKFLLNMLNKTENGVLEIGRNVLASRFNCAPSQINYVLSTRFTPYRGYYIESRRGGAGYVRIVHLPLRVDVVAVQPIRLIAYLQLHRLYVRDPEGTRRDMSGVRNGHTQLLSRLNDPCHLTQLWQIVITDAVFDEAVDDAGIEIIAGANCTDRCQRLHVIMYSPIFRV